MVGNPAHVITMLPWTDIVGTCGSITYQVFMNGVLTDSIGLINYDPISMKFKVETSDLFNIG